MDIEKRLVKLLMNGKKMICTELILFEEVVDDVEMVFLEITIDCQKLCYKSENFFSTLRNLREDLEKKNIQILCNGAAENIYPSSMQMSMGSGRMAYKLYMGQQAKSSNIVDIFDCEDGLNFVSIEKQSKYYAEWLQSVMG